MNKIKNIFKIMVLEDDRFYNDLLTKKLQEYTESLAKRKNYEFEILSFTNYDDFMRNLNDNTDIVFLDYYLGNGITATDIIKKIKIFCANCRIIIISQSQSMRASILTLKEGARHFIHKDQYALSKSCFLVEDIVNENLRKNT